MKKNLNILFTSDSLGVSGAELVLLTIMKNLNRGKFTPLLYCHVTNKELIERTAKINIECKTTSRFPGQEIAKSGVRLLKIVAYIRAIFNICRELMPYLRSESIDLIYANAYPNCLYYMLPALISKKPLIWHVHNIKKIHTQNYLIYKTAGMICSKIITVSDACKRNLLKAKIESSKIVTIYNGMDLRKFSLHWNGDKVRKQLGISQDTKIIGLFGQPIPEKGHKYFIVAASEVINVHSKCVFLIVGYLYKSDYQRYLYKLVKHLRLQNHIIFTGWREDIPDVMASIDVMAHTRVTPEPAALVLMEAMAMGKPIVTSGTGGTPELVLDNVTGVLVPPKNSQELARGIIYLLKNPQRAKQMGLDGRKRIEESYTVEKQLKKIENLCDGVIIEKRVRKHVLY